MQKGSQRGVFNGGITGVIGESLLGLLLPSVSGGGAHCPQKVRPEGRFRSIAAFHGRDDFEERLLGDVFGVGLVGGESPREL
jgi:hypothetical protein